MGLGKELEKLKYDKRLTDWHVAHGKISKDDLKKHLDQLPDLASNIEHFGLAEGAGGSYDSDDDAVDGEETETMMNGQADTYGGEQSGY